MSALLSLAECERFLWSDSGNAKARKKVDDNVRLFDSTFDWPRNESLRYVMARAVSSSGTADHT